MPKKQQHNLNLWFVPVLGRSSAGPRPDPHRGEAVPLPHLWHPLPPSADPEEPPAHSHRREALHCEPKAQIILIIVLLCHCLFDPLNSFQCEKCDLHFRHKSQLRLHLRQKHGAITNTKIRYKVLTEPYQPVLQACWRGVGPQPQESRPVCWSQ